MNIQYKAFIIHEENDRFFVQFPTISEAFTEGLSLSEALFNAQEVLSLSLEGRLEDGMEIPAPDTKKLSENEYFITPDASIQSALLIHFNRKKKSLTELATLVGIPIKGIEKPTNNLTLNHLEKIAQAMGKKLILDFA